MNSAPGCEFVVKTRKENDKSERERKKKEFTTLIIISDSNQSFKVIRSSVFAIVVGVGAAHSTHSLAFGFSGIFITIENWNSKKKSRRNLFTLSTIFLTLCPFLYRFEWILNSSWTVTK